jgi:hypothetical protein
MPFVSLHSASLVQIGFFRMQVLYQGQPLVGTLRPNKGLGFPGCADIWRAALRALAGC